jgi:UDP-glucose 4-epimerase
MRCLVTGGAGFIGSHLVDSLIMAGHNVAVVDDLSTGSFANLNLVKENNKFKFIEGNVVEISGLEHLIAESDIVYHLAAAVGVELVVHDPVQTIVTNVDGTERILKYTAKYGTRVLVTSTSEVYGKSNKNVFSEDDDLLIGPPSHSRWSYACSKLLDEFYCMAYFHSSKLPVVIARLFNTVGPRQTGQYGMVVPRFVEKALRGECVQVYGTGKQTRCFCHVHDTVRALIKLGESDISGKVFNIGSEWNISITQLAETIIKKLSSRSKIKYLSYDEAYEPGFEDMLHRFPDTAKIKEKLGWSATFSLEKIIDDVADYFRK